MSEITPLESVREYFPRREEEDSKQIEPEKQVQNKELHAPVVKAADQQQAEKTTVQGFQYTGKGSFIDKVF
jgi:hypothetical protein